MSAAPPRKPPTAPAGQQKPGAVRFAAPPDAGHRIVLYGPGGIGKTCLSMRSPGPVAFFDLDESLGKLKSKTPKGVNRLAEDCCSSWQAIRQTLQSDGWDEIKTIVVDTVTRAEEMCVAHVLQTVLTEKGAKATGIESYGYGKGLVHVFDAFLPLLADLDQHVRAGRNVILVAHDCTTPVPNPMGEDWLRYEPRLQSPSSGKSSIRLRLREWCDHLLFVGYDLDVRDGKGRGSGSRTLYPVETAFAMAKSRTLAEPIVVTEDSADVWQAIFGQEG